MISTQKWDEFEKSEDWSSASEINLGDLDDDIEMLTKLAEDETRICTYVDFDRVASLLREISQVNNPI